MYSHASCILRFCDFVGPFWVASCTHDFFCRYDFSVLVIGPRYTLPYPLSVPCSHISVVWWRRWYSILLATFAQQYIWPLSRRIFWLARRLAFTPLSLQKRGIYFDFVVVGRTLLFWSQMVVEVSSPFCGHALTMRMSHQNSSSDEDSEFQDD